MYYPCSENKGADQLHGYREADLRLGFRICKKPVFSRRGSYVLLCAYKKYAVNVPQAIEQSRKENQNVQIHGHGHQEKSNFGLQSDVPGIKLALRGKPTELKRKYKNKREKRTSIVGGKTIRNLDTAETT